MCINFQLTPQRLLKSAFSIRAFRGSEIRKISTKVELIMKSRNAGGGGKMQRSKSNENIPTSKSQMDIQMMSHTLAIKEVGLFLKYCHLHTLSIFLDRLGGPFFKFFNATMALNYQSFLHVNNLLS